MYGESVIGQSHERGAIKLVKGRKEFSVNQQTWNAVDCYLEDVLGTSTPALRDALSACHAAGLPPISVTPNQGKLLCLLAQMLGARSILEIGTLGGYSTIWFAMGLAPGGRIVTIECNEAHAKVARHNIAHAGFADRVEVRVGRGLDVLPELHASDAAPFDVVFIDADKPNNPGYFEWSLRLTKPGSVIVIDNVVREGSVVDAASSDASVQGVRRMHEMIRATPHVSAAALQTVGVKGYDGFTLVRVLK